MNAIAQMEDRRSPFELAVQALWHYRGSDRAAALGSSIKQLVNQHDISQPTAEIAAIQAFADLDSVNASTRIDIDASTSNVVVLRDAAGRPTMLTARDLAKVVQQARDAGLVRMVDADTCRPPCSTASAIKGPAMTTQNITGAHLSLIAQIQSLCIDISTGTADAAPFDYVGVVNKLYLRHIPAEHLGENGSCKAIWKREISLPPCSEEGAALAAQQMQEAINYLDQVLDADMAAEIMAEALGNWNEHMSEGTAAEEERHD